MKCKYLYSAKSAKNPHFEPLFIDKLLGMEYKYFRLLLLNFLRRTIKS